MSSVLDRINVLSEQWQACYHEMGVLAEGLAMGQSWDEEAEALLGERRRIIEGKLLQLWVARRHEKQSRNAEHSQRDRSTKRTRR